MGSSLRSLTSNSADPSVIGHCSRQKCLMCNSVEDGSGEKCWINNITYAIECLKCWTKDRTKVIYHGESSRSGYSRGLEHTEDLQKSVEGSPLWDHCRDSHDSLQLPLNNFKMTLTGAYKGPLKRQTAEGCLITKSIMDRDRKNMKIKILNSKNQFYQPGIVRTKVSSNEYD